MVVLGTDAHKRTAFRFLNAAMRTTAMNQIGIPSSARSAQTKVQPPWGLVDLVSRRDADAGESG